MPHASWVLRTVVRSCSRKRSCDLLGDRLPDGVTLLDLGAVRLRDLASPIRVYQLVHPALRESFPALRSLEATPNNLPQQVTSFIGRERQLAETKALLAKTRLLTLLGAGGLGKTRLSLQVGADLIDHYPDGVWLVELAPLSDPQLVAQAVASVLGVKEEAGKAGAGSAGEVRQRSAIVADPGQLRASAAGLRGVGDVVAAGQSLTQGPGIQP